MTRRVLFVALFAFSCAHPRSGGLQPADDRLKPVATSDSARRYTVLMAGNTTGAQVVTASGDETVVDFSFTVENGVAKWKNTAESGEEKAGSLYASMYGPPEELGILANALLRNGGRLPLAGGGEASIRKAGKLTLDGRRVTAYEISGFGFTPFEVWTRASRSAGKRSRRS
ncbi:MAG TPA: hypothetical protein VNA69_20980 [Thermoanaerobaculia bacterium]|nr:hypothetical protein [Thermoanaerobaculia bacterium]